MSAQSSAARLTGEVPKFDVVQAVTPVGTAPCAHCRGPIADTYYERDGRVICATCRQHLASEAMGGSGHGRFLHALAFGLGAAALGTALYFGLLAVTGREIELVAIVMGVLIGRAVRDGSGGRGGRRYQWLAVALTYLAIAGTYAPFVMRGIGEPVSTAADAAAGATVGIGALLLLAVAAPVLTGLGNIGSIGITIIALAVSGRMNRRAVGAITGPYRVRT